MKGNSEPLNLSDKTQYNYYVCNFLLKKIYFYYEIFHIHHWVLEMSAQSMDYNKQLFEFSFRFYTLLATRSRI